MNLVLNLIELASWKTRKNDTWLSCVITSQAGTSFVQSSHLSVQAKEANLLPDLRNRNPKGKAHYQVHVMEVSELTLSSLFVFLQSQEAIQCCAGRDLPMFLQVPRW
jgi:hypothetical protein